MDNNGLWIRLTAHADRVHLDDVTAVMSMIDNSLMIEDYSDVTTDGVYGDLIDEAILAADKSRVAVSVFKPGREEAERAAVYLRSRFYDLGIEAQVDMTDMYEEDWAESWKQYYKPIKLSRITVVPAWERYTPAEGELTIRMDPKTAFGTGTHETTRLVMEILCDEIHGGERVLDVGCGSGILSVCASKLGASFCAAYDIDPVAVRVAEENAREDGVTNMICGVSDLLASVDTSGGLYDFAVANIVADIIIRLSPDIGDYLLPGGRLVVSGIITERAPEVRAALAANGFEIIREAAENDWLAILCRKA